MFEVPLQARIDYAVDNVDALALTTGGLLLQQQVLAALVLRLKPAAVVERIKHSPFAKELLVCLPQYLGSSPEHLNAAAEYIQNNRDGWAEPYAYNNSFQRTYWPLLIKHYLVKKDFRRAWDELKRCIKLYPQDDPLSIDGGTLHTLLAKLAADLHAAGAMPKVEIKPYDTYTPSRTYETYTEPTVLPGLGLLRAMDKLLASQISDKAPYKLRPGDYVFSPTEQLIMALAKHFTEERNAKRARQVEQKVQAV